MITTPAPRTGSPTGWARVRGLVGVLSLLAIGSATVMPMSANAATTASATTSQTASASPDDLADQKIRFDGTGTGQEPAGCSVGTYTVPESVDYARITAVGQKGVTGKLGDHTAGAGGNGGIVQEVVAVRPGQTLWAAPSSNLFRLPYTSGLGYGGIASFVSTVNPQPYCDEGGSTPSTMPVNAFLIVAGGGGGGGAGVQGQGGNGGAAGQHGTPGGDNSKVNGDGGAAGTTTAGGAGGVGGYFFLFGTGETGQNGSYLSSGLGGHDADRHVDGGFAGTGGSGLYGGGGGGGGSGAGGGGGGGGSNYIPPYVPTTAPTSDNPSGTLQNGSIDSSSTYVEIVPYYTTTTTITSSPSPSITGESVTLSATVASGGGHLATGGTLDFRLGQTDLGTVPLVNGAATVNVAAGILSAGDNQFTTTYSGFSTASEVFQPNTGSYTHHVVQSVAPVITSGQHGYGTTYGSPITMESSATGVPAPTVQWQVAGSRDGSYADIPGATNPNYTDNALTIASHYYRAVYTNVAGSATTFPGQIDVKPAPLFVSADNASMDYDHALPQFTVRYGVNGLVDFVNGDTPASLGGHLVCSSDAVLSPGTHPITCTGQTSDHYRIVYQPGVLTVGPAAQSMTITSEPPDPATVGTVYTMDVTPGASGQPVTFTTDPASAPWCSVSADGDVSFVSDTSTGESGTCTVYANQAGRDSYPPSAQVQQSINVVKSAPVVTRQPFAPSATSGFYAQFDVDGTGTPDPLFQWYVSHDRGKTFEPIVGAVGKRLALIPTMAMDGYVYKALLYNAAGDTPSTDRVFSDPALLHVVPFQIAVVPNDVSTTYGTAPPVIEPTYHDFVRGETPESLGLHVTCGSDATATSPAGQYDSVCQGFDNIEYEPLYILGTVTVDRAPLSVTAGNVTATIGHKPVFTARYHGLVAGDTATSLSGTLLCGTPMVTGPGTYPITCSGQSSPNYDVTYVGATLTVKAAAAGAVGGTEDGSVNNASPPVILPDDSVTDAAEAADAGAAGAAVVSAAASRAALAATGASDVLPLGVVAAFALLAGTAGILWHRSRRRHRLRRRS
ncbi:MAG: hypothetical protein JWQ64_310 [Subtercola sp.]|nr:hypothetical protein [Subtercola sp.]